MSALRFAGKGIEVLDRRTAIVPAQTQGGPVNPDTFRIASSHLFADCFRMELSAAYLRQLPGTWTKLCSRAGEVMARSRLRHGAF